MTQQIILNEKDRKTKKRWLISMVIYLVFNLIGTYSFLAPLDTKGELPQALSIMAFFLLVLYGLLYYFSYIKQGHRLLTGFLIGPIFSLLKNATKLKDFFEIKDLTNFLIVIIWMILVNGWFYYESIKLIYLNKRLKTSFTSQEFKDGIGQLHASKNVQDLDSKFHALINQFPQFEPTLSKEYQKQKIFIEGSSSN